MRRPGISQSGQALVALVVFMSMGITLLSAAAIVTITNSLASANYNVGQAALSVAEAGADNAAMQLLRLPSTYAGETLNINDGTATITISGAWPKTITSVGQVAKMRRTVQATATLSGNVITISNWSEVP